MRMYLNATAILILMVITQTVHANYALFNDVTDTIQIDGHTLLGSAATYEARIYLLGSGGRIFNEWLGAAEDKMLDLTNGELRAYSYDVNRGSLLTASVAPSLHAWHHFAYVYDGSEERLYLDGQIIKQRAGSGDIRDSASGVAGMGGFMREGFRPSFIGLMDTFRVSSIARYVGASFAVPTGDFVPDADTQMLFNFTESPGSLTVTGLGQAAATGILGSGYDTATTPSLVTNLPASGDLDYDGFVGITDLNLLLGSWNQTVSPGDAADPTGDNFVGIEDLNLVLGNWNAGIPPGAQADNVIPEPGTLALLGLGAFSVIRRQRR
jgi:concanavalin A-like lectin/glucanase superfamily protein/PEP-CTERM motif-containing protein